MNELAMQAYAAAQYLAHVAMQGSSGELTKLREGLDIHTIEKARRIVVNRISAMSDDFEATAKHIAYDGQNELSDEVYARAQRFIAVPVDGDGIFGVGTTAEAAIEDAASGSNSPAEGFRAIECSKALYDKVSLNGYDAAHPSYSFKVKNDFAELVREEEAA